jgi:hypothetical protein
VSARLLPPDDGPLPATVPLRIDPPPQAPAPGYAAPLPAGTVLKGWRIAGVVGQGGFGVVYRAESVETGEASAIKEYLPAQLAIRAADGWLELVVANSGRWVPPDKMRSPSTGIRSLRQRLALLIDEDATVDTVIDPDLDGGWVRVVIRMPATLVQPPQVAESAGTPKPDPAAAHEPTLAPESV